MNDKWLRDRLARPLDEDAPEVEKEEISVVEDPQTPTETTTSNNILEKATLVMAAYQNANKWLDSLKEYILMDLGCVHFSNYVHNLAHTMPARFDKFGDILHSADFKIPYPATEQFTNYPSDAEGAIQIILDIIRAIHISLRVFADAMDSEEYSVLALMTDELLLDISREYVHLHRMKRIASSCDNLVMFDNWVAQYVANLGTLID